MSLLVQTKGASQQPTPHGPKSPGACGLGPRQGALPKRGVLLGMGH